jgi:hypothetical protein
LSVVSGFPPVAAATRLASTGGFGAGAGGGAAGAVATGAVAVAVACGADMACAEGAAGGADAGLAGGGAWPAQPASVIATHETRRIRSG